MDLDELSLPVIELDVPLLEVPTPVDAPPELDGLLTSFPVAEADVVDCTGEEDEEMPSVWETDGDFEEEVEDTRPGAER